MAGVLSDTLRVRRTLTSFIATHSPISGQTVKPPGLPSWCGWFDHGADGSIMACVARSIDAWSDHGVQGSCLVLVLWPSVHFFALVRLVDLFQSESFKVHLSDCALPFCVCPFHHNTCLKMSTASLVCPLDPATRFGFRIEESYIYTCGAVEGQKSLMSSRCTHVVHVQMRGPRPVTGHGLRCDCVVYSICLLLAIIRRDRKDLPSILDSVATVAHLIVSMLLLRRVEEEDEYMYGLYSPHLANTTYVAHQGWSTRKL